MMDKTDFDAPSPPATNTENAAKFGLALTAVFPWLFNYYIADNGLGPEMTPEVSSSVAVIVTSLLNRVIDK